MDADSPTRTEVSPATPAPIGEVGLPPGALLANRYRIVAPLGRGGMGEVYRAEDVTLGHPVALKFIPQDVAGDPQRLTRLLNEVKVARQVSHPNVCRVHDIGEAGGRHFLSMEYVDGEDLSSLLRRIGRLPAAKGLELARQICQGLAAAHDRGVLHRDLKPANVMIDGRGCARLTDFGLAVLAAEAPTGEVAGTPAYMAPEQLAGVAPTVRSDIYSLGLLLYELFTGRAAFRAASVPEMVRMQRETAPTPPSVVAPEIEPSIERTILRCLEKDPERRPGSVAAVAAGLPGGDPLAALVAAGETPPPELVAATADVGVLRRSAAWACLALVLAAFPLTIALTRDLILFRQVPLPKRPEVLADRASGLIRALTDASNPSTSAHGLIYTTPPRVGASPATFGAPGQSPIAFWYREAPGRLEGLNLDHAVDEDDPPTTMDGMVTVRLDPSGRLVSLLSVPSATRDEAANRDGGEPWTAAFREAGLDPSRFHEAAPTAVLPLGAGVRRAWDGSATEDPQTALHVEGSATGDRLRFFRVYAPGDPLVPASPSTRSDALQTGASIAYLLALAGAAVLARRNLRLGRTDRAGARRVGAATFVIRFLVWLLEAPHTWNVTLERGLIVDGISHALYNAAVVWLFYVAVEPTVRRRWPRSLVSWTRLLTGRFRDPMVGRDALVGMAAAAGVGLIFVLGRRLGAAPGTLAPGEVRLDMLLGWRPFAAWMLQNLIVCVTSSLFAVVVVVALRALVRHARAADLCAVAVFILLIVAGPDLGPWKVPLAVIGGIALAALIRSGLFAVMVGSFFVCAGRPQVPVTLELGAWYAAPTLGWLIVGVSVALYGFWVSQGGRPFAGALADE